jgi:hypothetical protein
MRPRAHELAGIALLAGLAHATALPGRFLWLDHGDLEAGAAIAPLSQLLGLFTRGFARTGFYRPLTAVALSLDAAWHAGPLPFHLTNLVAHALAAALVVVLGSELGLSRLRALAAGALFAVHPVTAVVTGAIAYRAEALLTVALLSALIGHLRGRFGLTLLGVLAAGLFKETGLVLAPLLLLALAPRRWLPVGVGTGLALLLRLAFAPAWRASFPPLTLVEHVGTRGGAVLRSALALVSPWTTGLCDDTPVLGLLAPAALVGLAILLALVWLGVRAPGAPRLFTLSLLPALVLVPVPRFWSPHYLYVPLAFGALALAGILPGSRAVRVVSGLVLAGCATLSLLAGLRYLDDEALFLPEVAARPSCREGWLYIGDARRTRGDAEGSLDAYAHALAPTPGVLAYVDRAAAAQNLGVAALSLGELGQAERAFREGLRLSTDAANRRALIHDLAVTRLQMGHPEETLQLLGDACVRPESLPLCVGALQTLGRHDDAAALRARAEGVTP